MRKRSEAKSRPQREEQVPTREFEIDTPNDPINEEVVLAAMLVDQETCDRLLPMCPVDAFYSKEHQIIRTAIGEARRKGLATDPAILLRLNPEVDQLRVERMMRARPEPPDDLDTHHVDALLWDARRAAAARGPLGEIVNLIQDPRAERERVRAVARDVYEAFAGDRERARFLRDPKEVVRSVMTELRNRAQGAAHYPYGIDGLDFFEDGKKRMRPGCNPGGWTLVSSVSGSGKSTMMAHLAIASARQRRKVLFGAWEEEAPVTLELLTTLALKWSRSRVLDGKSNQIRTEDGGDWAPLTHEDLVLFEETAHKISRWVTFFDNPFQHRTRSQTGRRITNDDHLDIIEDHVAQSGASVFFADLLHRCFIDDTPSDERHTLFRMLHISQTSKIHTVAAHQQRSKDIEQRANKRPTREGIIGTGAWLDVPWTVIAPHIPAKWKEVPDTTLELYILKQRRGPWPLGIEFDWDPDTGQISGGRSINVKNVSESDGVFETSAGGSEKARSRKPSRMERAGFSNRKRNRP